MARELAAEEEVRLFVVQFIELNNIQTKASQKRIEARRLERERKQKQLDDELAREDAERARKRKEREEERKRMGV